MVSFFQTESECLDYLLIEDGENDMYLMNQFMFVGAVCSLNIFSIIWPV